MKCKKGGVRLMEKMGWQQIGPFPLWACHVFFSAPLVSSPEPLSRRQPRTPIARSKRLTTLNYYRGIMTGSALYLPRKLPYIHDCEPAG